MRFSASFAIASLVSAALAAPSSPLATDTADVYAAQATALTESPTSKVKGKSFDRYVSIWLENTDYDTAAADRNSLSHSSPLPQLIIIRSHPLRICKEGYPFE